MKDKNLNEQLNNYADSLERREEILYGAYRAMDEKNRTGAYGKKKSNSKLIFGFAAFAAAAFIFVIAIGVILSNLILQNNGGVPSAPYSLSTLNKKSVPQDEFQGVANAIFLNLEDGASDGRFFIYVNDKNEVCAARAIYKVMRDGNVDEIEVLSDLKNNLSDYKNKPSSKNPVVRNFDSYENGEYYSYLAAAKNNTTYYINITSPSQNAGEYYENLLL